MSEIRVNTIANAEGIAAPTLPYGVQIPTGMGITGAGGVNVSGALTASNFTGNLTGLINSAGVSTIARLEATKDINVGAAVTISGIAKVSNTTASTSTSTGALIVSGGAGIGGDVWIGAGLSVAGTLTYQDVTEVDAVGLITAQSGINITGGSFTQTGGGEFKVGSALTVGSVGVATFIGAAGVAVTITPSTGKVQATAIEGPLTGNVTGDLTGNATSGLSVSGGGLSLTGAGEFKVGTGVTIASTSGVTTFAEDTYFVGAAGKSMVWDKSAGRLLLEDSGILALGTAADLKLQHDGSNSYIDNVTGALYLRTSSTDKAVVCTADGGVALHWDDAEKYTTTGAGSTSVGISTVQDFSSVGMLKERVEIVANKLSAGTNIDLAKGNVWYYSTNETTTATPNFRYDGTDTLNNKMLIGDTVTAVIISKPNGAGYYAACTVDGSGVTEEWLGGSAPSAANAGGYDVTTHTLTKIGSGSFICLSNVSNYA